MNAIQTLLWLEWKRSSWVLYGAATGLALFGLILYSLAGTSTGLEMVGVPAAGEEQCIPPDCEPSGQTQVEIQSESGEGGSSFGWSFSKTWGGDSPPPPESVDPDAGGQTIPIDVPEALQFAIRPRQIATLLAGLAIPTLMLLGYWISYSREADRGDMVMLYQSPVSGDVQLLVRFLYVSLTMLAVSLATIAMYWVLQKSQSLAPLAPLVEALGSRAEIHWGNLVLAGLITLTLPNAAFVLLFIQMQNAYDLLGGQRLAAFVLILVSVVSFFVSFVAADPPTGSAVLPIISIESNAMLDSVIDSATFDRFRVEVALDSLVVGAGLTLAMLFASGRIWREVEWS